MAATSYRNILITGGCGFVGSNLALRMKRVYPNATITAFDNFSRRGSELNRPRLEQQGITVVEGDVRNREQLESLSADLILDCAAEPSVLAGRDGTPLYVTDVNLGGTLNCLELARKNKADFVFLSSSRVYPIAPINALASEEKDTRFELSEKQTTSGASGEGISEGFPLEGVRTLYGATKLASELFVQEFISTFGIRGVINRCGVIAGPWQFGKVDQGFVPLWIARHIFGGRLTYIGYEGKGKQVRDVLHIDDLCSAVVLELEHLDEVNGRVFNVGGGLQNTVSLIELTALCREVTGKEVAVDIIPEGRPGDIRFYVTDHRSFTEALGWRPEKNIRNVVEDTYRWMKENEVALRPIFI
ncbi:NAD-dependent epimerase/dehydratase family protein [Candidatus Kaiserbacteria bacterium]|nr:NAD-dependent epimerase/dehydratase family protein [Candidatus Kaiserbacteria bacterium]